MQRPTIAQLRTTIDVLKKLEQRLDSDTACVMRLPDSRFGDQHAERIETRTLQQTGQIQSVVAQLEKWRDELNQQRRQCVSHHV
jgi:hypothetical protein